MEERQNVYICHSLYDNHVADNICLFLELNGVKCWMAPRDVKRNERHAKAVYNSIRRCDVVVVVYTKNTNKAEYVIDELDIAFKAKRRIIPFLVDDSTMNAELNYYLPTRYRIPAYPCYPEKLDHLLTRVRILLGLNKNAHIPVTEIINSSEFYYIGCDYYFGNNGKKEDHAIASRWFNIAATDCVEAQYNLGVMYFNGDGVNLNPFLAEYCFNLAAKNGHIEAQSFLGEMYYKGLGVSKNLSEAEKWLKMAAENGSADAQCNLGVMYYFGDGVNKDIEEAQKLLAMSVDGGCEEARKALEEIKQIIKK